MPNEQSPRRELSNLDNPEFQARLKELEEWKEGELDKLRKHELYQDVVHGRSYNELLQETYVKPPSKVNYHLVILRREYEECCEVIEHTYQERKQKLMLQYAPDSYLQVELLPLKVEHTRKGELDLKPILVEMRVFEEEWRKLKEKIISEYKKKGDVFGDIIADRAQAELEKGEWEKEYFNNWPTLKYLGIQATGKKDPDEKYLQDLQEAKSAVGGDWFKVYVYLRTKKGYSYRDLTA